MPRLKTWIQEYPGGPWRTQCGGYLLEANEAGRSLADLAAAGEDDPSWAVRRAGLGTMGDPTAGQVAGDIADSLEAAQDLAELEVIRLLANDASVRALLVGVWLSPDEVERLNHQMLDLLAIADALGMPDPMSQVTSIKITFFFNGLRYSIEADAHGRRTLRGFDGKAVSMATRTDGWVNVSPLTDFADRILGLFSFRAAKFLPGAGG